MAIVVTVAVVAANGYDGLGAVGLGMGGWA